MPFFLCTANSLYAYSLKDLYSAATGMEIKLPGLEQDPQWEKNIDHTTHHLSPLRFGIRAWLLLGWRVLVFLPLFCPDCPCLGEGAEIGGFVRISQ